MDAPEPIRDPSTYSVLSYLWVISLASFGGVVSYLRKVKMGVEARFAWRDLLLGIVTSAFAGILTFWLCGAAHFNPLLTAALVGISGHLGSNALNVFDNFFIGQFGSRK